ncbi:Transposon-encoded protein TnpW, partial [Dysosmobacter welbionis]
HCQCGSGAEGGSGEDAGAGPECGVMEDEAHQHRIRQSGLRRPAGGCGGAGLGPHQAHGAGVPGAG